MVHASSEGERAWAEARRLNDLGDFRAAAATLDDARALLSSAQPGDEHAARLLVRVDITGALTTLELEGYDAAADLLGAARSRARDVGARDLIALTHVQQGVIDARSGSWAAAREELLAAVGLMEHLGPADQCSTLITLGLAELSLRRVDEATARLDQARTIAAAHDLDAHLFKATHNLGCAHFVAGDVPEALRLMAQADEMTVQVARDRAHLDHAEALMDAGLVEEAGELRQAALRDAREAGHRLDVGDILLELARCALLQHDHEGARRDARAAIAAFRTRQADSRRALAELFLAGIDLAEGGPAERALAAARLWDAPDPQTAEQVEAVLLTAEAEVARERPEAAREALATLAPTSRLRLPVQLHAHYLEAVVADRTGRDEEFGAAARRASEILTAAQSSLRSLELRAAVAQHADRLAQLDLARAVRSGSAAASLDTIERWRGASARARELTLSADPEISTLLQELRWLASPMSPAAPEDPVERDRAIAELQQQIAARARQASQSSEGAVTTAMTYERLVAALPAGTAYLTFARTHGMVQAVVVDATGTQVLRSLGPSGEIEQAVATARRDLRGRAFARRTPELYRAVTRAWEESSARLGELLLGPVAEQLSSSERLVIAPNASLHAVAWASLPAVEHRPVTVTSSAARWARQRAAGPLDLRRVSAHAGPGLPEAGDEVRAVRRTWSTETAGTGSSEQAVGQDLAQALAQDDLVHVAAHGHHAGDNPLFSSLRLHDGPLFAHDLVHEVHAGHVVLSACDVGQARVRVGGEALGMTAALLALGVGSVVAAVAPIADVASAQASRLYHEGLAGGLDAAAALASAVRDTPGAEPLVCFGGDLQVRRPQG